MTRELKCRRCDFVLPKDGHIAFLARHISAKHGISQEEGLSEAWAIADDTDASARIDALEAEITRLRAALDRADDMANALVVYFNKRGADHSMRKGNEDIGALADALSNYGPLRLVQMDARRALDESEA